MRKCKQAIYEMVTNVNCQILRDGVEVRKRWAEYLEHILNLEDVREANKNVVGGRRMQMV